MSHLSRRQLLALGLGGAVAGAFTPYVYTSAAEQKQAPKSKNDRPRIGAVGLRYQGTVITHKAQAHGDIAAVCDVDRNVREQARASFGSTPLIFEDYRKLLDRKDIDVVMIGTPDHWHTKIAVDACRAGKDVYVEKPLTLTIDEGKILRKVVQETGRVVQVGSWQRSDHRFRTAVEMVRQGRIGKLQRVEIILGKNLKGGPFPTMPVPTNLNWDLWQGQTADVPYIEQRCHYTFRWWHEYSGGQMTDWGAHHIDIAQWAINSLPVRIEGQAKYPDVPDGYNVALDYAAQYTFANSVVMTVGDTGRNGIMFIGDQGKLFVNRGTLSGKPVDELEANPLPREKFQVYAHDNLERPERFGKLDAIVNHMGNFFDCLRTRQLPVSDIASSHRTTSTCHLGNIAMKLGRPLTWDPQKEQFVGDDQANSLLSRPQRKGFEIKA